MRHIWQDSKCRYGVLKVWQQMKADGIHVARCTVERLMTQYELQGVWRGKGKITTHSRDDQKRAIVGWKVSNRMNTDMVMPALNQSIL
ncbi:IS3 family transposase [Psychrobacter sp. 1176_08]|uniref:IS3 family transposase n=1 Tax=Psychrobacter sp. 1176_08 TaxID=2604452 RepID=UPI004063B660